jgi:diguanylate cyclase (GGDEF)-like protein
MMIKIVIPILFLLSGICAYASVNHLFIALRRPLERSHLLFAIMCLLMAPFSISHAMALQAGDISEFISALRWNLAAPLLFFLFFPWFIALYTGKRPLPLLAGLSALFAALFTVNLTLPYTIQYDRFDGIRVLYLPWGEAVTLGVGHNGFWAYIAIGGVLTTFGYALYALAGLYYRYRQKTNLCMMLAIGLFLVSSMEGILVRLSAIDFIHLGPFGFLIVVLVMSATLRHEIMQRLHNSERRFRSLVEQSPFSIQTLSPDGYTRQVNPAWEKLWGMKAEDLAHYNILHDQQLVEKGVMPYVKKGFAGEASEIPPIVYNPADNPILHGPVRDRWVRAFIYPIKDEGDAMSDVILMHEDVTEKKRVEDAIRLIAAGVSAETGERFFQQLVLSMARLFKTNYAFIGVLDERDAQQVNTIAVCAHGEIAPNLSYALQGTPCANVIGQNTCAYPQDVQKLFPEDRLLAEMNIEGYIGTPLFGAKGQPLGIMVVLDSKPLNHIEQVREIMDIFAARAGAELQRLQAEKHIRQLAYYDNLTGLATRAHLHERLQEILSETRIIRDQCALLLINLDHFKTINDALSHDVGDEALRMVARRLKEAVGEGAFLARLGGDEFVVMPHNRWADAKMTKPAVQRLAEQILGKLQTPLFIAERSLSIRASIGIVLFPENSGTALDIMRHADMALYHAKNIGRGTIQFYSPEMQVAVAKRLQMEEGLRRAVDEGEMEIYFQPQVNTTGMVISAEALLRWHHPEMGSIPPATFIPIAEETGLIHTIGRWALDQACERFAAWQRSKVPFAGHLSVNVCPWQFARPDFVEQVRQTLTKYRINPGCLMLELTETALLYNIEEANQKLSALHALGIKIALDDFGTGYSSLAYLRDLQIDQIKIDKAFISELSSGSVEHPLVESMIAIGKHMSLPIVAEGVETEAQYATLVKMGCESFQGYLFCRPLPERGFIKWLVENQSSGRWSV